MMTEQEMRVAIAQACGWTYYPLPDDPNPEDRDYWGRQDQDGSIYETSWNIPDYLHDLNAMHEAEKVLLGHGDVIGMMYNQELFALTKEDWVWSATARQRAEAFCRTLFPERFK